jgi:hypothetical protein
VRISVLPPVSDTQEAEIVDWLRDVAAQLALLGGALPQPDTQVLVQPLPGVSSPVPWGEVTRGGGSAVHLYVGLGAGVERWRADWTASHEFAHLLHPFVGDAGRWLSEGLASYYQNVLRARSGQLSPDVAWLKLQQGFERGRGATPEGSPALQQAASTRMRGSTMRVYWAGAAFWLETDRALRRGGDSLDALLTRFAAQHGDTACCWTPQRFIEVLHQLAPKAGLTARYRSYAASTRFPISRAQQARWTTELQHPDQVLGAVFAPLEPEPPARAPTPGA